MQDLYLVAHVGAGALGDEEVDARPGIGHLGLGACDRQVQWRVALEEVANIRTVRLTRCPEGGGTYQNQIR